MDEDGGGEEGEVKEEGKWLLLKMTQTSLKIILCLLVSQTLKLVFLQQQVLPEVAADNYQPDIDLMRTVTAMMECCVEFAHVMNQKVCLPALFFG